MTVDQAISECLVLAESPGTIVRSGLAAVSEELRIDRAPPSKIDRTWASWNRSPEGGLSTDGSDQCLG